MTDANYLFISLITMGFVIISIMTTVQYLYMPSKEHENLNIIIVYISYIISLICMGFWFNTVFA